MIISEVEAELAKFIRELENEDRLVRVGLKDTADSASIYKKYSKLFTKETLLEISDKLKVTKGAKPREILERIYFTIAGSFIGLKLAADSDKLTTYFSSAKVKIGDEEVAYYQLVPRISKETIFVKREFYDDAATKVVVRANPKQLALLKEEIALLKLLGFKSYLDYFADGKKIDYAKFYKVVKKIQKDTDKLWVKVMSQVSQEVLGRPFKNIKSCHMTFLRSISMFDNFYPVAKVVSTFEQFTNDIGLSDLLSTINIDDVDRPKKNPRAVCYWPDPPREIHLVIKPIGGEQDFEALFHEGGHALHGASVDKKLPYTFRNISRSNALTETYAFILEDLVFDPMFLTKYLNVSSHSAGKIQWQAHFVNLMMLRRYLGKFAYEYELFKSGKLANGPSLYAKNLKNSTGFISKKENWLTDMDSGFYSADYLRAWIAAAQIKDYLSKKYTSKWFLNPKAGKFLRDLYSRGTLDEVEDVVVRLGYKPFDTSLLTSGYKSILG